MTVLVLVVAIAFALALLPFRRKITPIATHNAVAWALIVVFAKLAIPDTARAVDQWIGVTGISRVVYQTLLIAALLVWLKTATFYTHDMEWWRRHARGPVALLALSNLAWLLIRFSGGDDGAYYGGFAARPWPAFLMNMSIAASYAWVAIELIAYHVHVLRTRGAGADRSYLISAIVLMGQRVAAAGDHRDRDDQDRAGGQPCGPYPMGKYGRGVRGSGRYYLRDEPDNSVPQG